MQQSGSRPCHVDAHEEELGRNGPLKAVVCVRRAVNWSNHHGTDKSIFQQHRELGASMLSSSRLIWWKQGGNASLARVNATSMRTAEVTISIALDSYRAPVHEFQADTASYNCVFRCGIFRVWENGEEGLGASSPMR